MAALRELGKSSTEPANKKNGRIWKLRMKRNHLFNIASTGLANSRENVSKAKLISDIDIHNS